MIGSAQDPGLGRRIQGVAQGGHDDRSRQASLPSLGARLRAARQGRRIPLGRAAEAAGIERADLAAYEADERAIPSRVVDGLLALYGTTLAHLAPEREGDDVRLAGDVLHVASERRGVGDDEASVLDAYLGLVYQLRGLRRGDPIPLRDDDLDALARALGGEPAEIEARLVELMHCTPEEAVRIRKVLLRRRVLVPAAALVMGAGALTATAMHGLSSRLPTTAPSTTTTSTTTPEPATPPVRIGTPLLVERTPDGIVTIDRDHEPPPTTP